jgi:PKD repeat protein
MISAKKAFVFILYLLVVYISSGIYQSYGQQSIGGIPYSFRYHITQDDIPTLVIPAPDPVVLAIEDKQADKNGFPYRYAVNIPMQIDLLKYSHNELLSNGDHLYRLKISAKSALALSAYFDDFFIPEGGLLYLYDASGNEVIGGFTSVNNQDNHYFATQLLNGDLFTLEYYEPNRIQGFTKLHLTEISYAYRGVNFRNNDVKGFGGSGACEVNINCSEGQDWQNQKKAVVRIGIKIGAGSFWCTGTLLNNTQQDYKPYLLTADHCGSTATPADLSQWVFYFNYEGLDCSDPLSEPLPKALTGAVKKASSGGNGQIKDSDLYLILLNNQVPNTYNPYYCGWNRQNTPSTSGVCIHHPEGDIKKISTYLTPIVSTSWGSTPGSHWSVHWAQTQHGFGVTEPGSSGSPLFNTQGDVIGQLSGGESSCTNTAASDLYGKFSYSWQPAGSDSSNSLHFWLDPANSGAVNIPGLAPNIVYVVANFTVDQDTFIVGKSVNFVDLSSGNPTNWRWTFTGAEPSSSSEQHPANIVYKKAGVYSVNLIAANNATSDTVEKKSYITVLPHVFPVPFNDHVTLDFGSETDETPEIQMYDVLGRQVKFLLQADSPGTRYNVYLKNQVSGLYYLKIKVNNLNLSKKVMFIKTANP